MCFTPEVTKVKIALNYNSFDSTSYLETCTIDLFLPSFALQCNLLARAFDLGVWKNARGEYETIQPTARDFVDQYQNNPAGRRMRCANTFIRYDDRKGTLCHYPVLGGFSLYGKHREYAGPINLQRESSYFPLAVDPETERNVLFLEFVLRDHSLRKQVQNLTGLQAPEILLDIADYFAKPAVLDLRNVPSGNSSAYVSTHLGCSDDSFVLAVQKMDYRSPFQGVTKLDPSSILEQ